MGGGEERNREIVMAGKRGRGGGGAGMVLGLLWAALAASARKSKHGCSFADSAKSAVNGCEKLIFGGLFAGVVVRKILPAMIERRIGTTISSLVCD